MGWSFYILLLSLSELFWDLTLLEVFIFTVSWNLLTCEFIYWNILLNVSIFFFKHGLKKRMLWCNGTIRYLTGRCGSAIPADPETAHLTCWPGLWSENIQSEERRHQLPSKSQKPTPCLVRIRAAPAQFEHSPSSF